MMENGYKEYETPGPPRVPSSARANVIRGRGRGTRQPTLDDYRVFFESAHFKAQSGVVLSQNEEKPLNNVGKGRGRLRNAPFEKDNFKIPGTIREHCINFSGNSEPYVLSSSLQPKSSKEWFSDGNSGDSSPKKHSQAVGLSRSDAEVYYSRYNSSDSFDDARSSTLTSSSTGRNGSEQRETCVGQLESVNDPNAKVEYPFSVIKVLGNDENDTRIDQAVVKIDKSDDAVHKSVKIDVQIDNTNVRREISIKGGVQSELNDVVVTEVINNDVTCFPTDSRIVDTDVRIHKSDDTIQKTDNLHIGSELNYNGGVKSKNNGVVVAKVVKNDVTCGRNDSRMGDTDVRIVKSDDTVKFDVKVVNAVARNDVNNNGGVKSKKNYVAAAKTVKTDITNDQNNARMPKGATAVDKTVKTIFKVGSMKKINKIDIKVGSCERDKTTSRGFDDRDSDSKLDESVNYRNKRENVVDNWWDIETVSQKSSVPCNTSSDIPERNASLSRPSSFIPLSTFSLSKCSNQSVYGNWETAYLSDVRAFDAFGKPKRNTFPRFSIEHDFPVLGANVATNTAIRPPSPIVRNVEQQRESKKSAKQVSKPNAPSKATVAQEVPVRDSNSCPGSIEIANLPKHVSIGFLRDFLEVFGVIGHIVLVPSDLCQIAHVTFMDREVCSWVVDVLNDSPVPMTGCSNILTVKLL